jgi:stage V sporulation protein AC
MVYKNSRLDSTRAQSSQPNQEQEYQKMVNKLKPNPPYLRNALAAFSVGGFICALAQASINLFLQLGLTTHDAGTATVVLMFLMGALLTGLGIYDDLGKFAGAGSIIPITGFANVIVASALEWKREGYIFGVAAKMFTIAGPVLVYGIITSALIAIIILFWG